MTPPETSRAAAATRWANRIADLLCSGPVVGLVLGLCLFVYGALSLGTLSYMGESSEELKQLAIQVYGAQVAREHLKILSLYLALGLAGGLLAAGLCALRDHLRGRGRPSSRLWRVGRLLLLLGGLHLYFLARSVIIYPQLYAESFYDRGGLLRTFQVVLTEHFSPGLIDALMLLSLSLFVLLPLVGVLRARGWRWRRPARRQLLGAGVAVGLVAAVLVSLGLATSTSKATDNQGPNIVIIAVDSLRSDRVADPRYRRVAPRIQRLADRSVRFERAYGTLARTFPSWLTMLTGQEPHRHGIRHMFPTWEARGRTGPSLPQHLRRAGWETAVVSDYAGEIFGRVRLGFHHVDVSSFSFYEIIRQRVLKAHTHLMPYLATATGRELAPPLRGLPENSDPRILAGRVNRMLSHVARKKRFLLVAFFSAAHFPYAAPYPNYRRFTKRSYRGPYKYHKQRKLGERATPPAADIQHIRGLYDGSVAAGDEAIGMVLDHLERLGVAGRTIVVLTADHGENLYEANLGMGHGDHLRGEQATRLPLVIHDPVNRLGARKVQSIVRDVDLAPTLAALVGHPLGKTAGRDLRPLINGQAPKDPQAAFMETGLWFTPAPQGLSSAMRMAYPPVLGGLVQLDQKRRGDLVLNPRFETLAVAAKHRAIRTPRWKLIYAPLADGVRFRLYDVQKDPHNTRDVAKEHPEVTKRLKKRLTRWMLGEPGAIKVGDYVLPGR